MNAVPFDTLNMARRLQASGLEGQVAAGLVDALVEAMTGADLATKSDVGSVAASVDGLRTELKGEIAALRTELKGDAVILRTEFKSDLELLRRDIVIKCGAMMVMGVGVMITAMRFFMHP